MTVLRDLLRRRLRSALTISGVAVGVFAVVVLGAMAEKADMTLRRNAAYYADKVVVSEKQGGTGGLGYGFNNTVSRPLTEKKIEELKAYPGVMDAAPQVVLSLDEQAMPVGSAASVAGGFVGTEEHPEAWKAAKGRLLAESERGVAVVGSNLVRRLDAEIGGGVNVRGEEFEVVGITEITGTSLDDAVIVPLADSQRLALRTLPPVFARSLTATSIVGQVTLHVDPGTDADELATLIGRDVKGVRATGPAGLRKQLGGTLAVFSGLLASVGAVALLVGCLSVVNTMIMSVSERNREMGLKRALGASRSRVARDIVAESTLVGLLGGLLGLIAGSLVAAVGNATLASGGAPFLVTARLAFGALAFAAVLGGVAGLYPAWRTVRMDPVVLLTAR